MGRSPAWLTGALLLSAPIAHAEWSVTITGTTDYDFRGTSQTQGDPALQASVDFEEGLFYASIWGSNVDFGEGVDGSLEVDFVAGLAGETVAGFRWDVGGTYYLYPGSNDDLANDVVKIGDYGEIYAGGGYGPLDAKIWYSPSLYDSSDEGWYAEVNLGVPLPNEFTFFLHAGYSFGDWYDELEKALGDPGSSDFDPDYGSDDAEYADYAFGVRRPFGNFDAELKVVTTDTDSYFEINNGASRNDTRIILSVSTTFPWGGE